MEKKIILKVGGGRNIDMFERTCRKMSIDIDGIISTCSIENFNPNPCHSYILDSYENAQKLSKFIKNKIYYMENNCLYLFNPYGLIRRISICVKENQEFWDTVSEYTSFSEEIHPIKDLLDDYYLKDWIEIKFTNSIKRVFDSKDSAMLIKKLAETKFTSNVKVYYITKEEGFVDIKYL